MIHPELDLSSLPFALLETDQMYFLRHIVKSLQHTYTHITVITQARECIENSF